MQKILMCIVLVLVISAVSNAALLKTIVKSPSEKTDFAKVAGVLAQVAPEKLKEAEKSEDAKGTGVAKNGVSKSAKKKKQGAQSLLQCAREGVFPTEDKPCCKGLELRSGVCRPVEQESGFNIPCTREGLSSMVPCCEGLVRDNSFVCRSSCVREGEAAWSGIPCCQGLRSIGVPPICINTACRQEGEAYSPLRANCCEGLDFDEETRECKPRRIATARVSPARTASLGCDSEEHTRLEQKLDELLRRLET